MRADDDVDRLATKINALIEQEVLPALDAKQPDADLVALWKSGRAPLLADARRLPFFSARCSIAPGDDKSSRGGDGSYRSITVTGTAVHQPRRVGLDHFRAPKIWSLTSPANLPSLKVLGKIGMRYVKDLTEDGVTWAVYVRTASQGQSAI